MSDVKVPTVEEKAATVNILNNIHELLKRGLFFGENSGYVFEAMSWITKCVDDLKPAPLAAVPDESELQEQPQEVVLDGQA